MEKVQKQWPGLAPGKGRRGRMEGQAALRAMGSPWRPRDQPPTLRSGPPPLSALAPGVWLRGFWNGRARLWSSDSVCLLPRSVLGTLSGSLRPCLSCLLCHKRMAVLPLCFLHVCPHGWSDKYSLPAGFLSSWHLLLPLSGDANSWRTKGTLSRCCNAQQWKELALVPKIEVTVLGVSLLC